MNSLRYVTLSVLGLFICIIGVAQSTPTNQGNTKDFTDRASFVTAVGGSSKAISFDGIRAGADFYSSYDHGPIVVSGITFSTSTPKTFVNVTSASHYSPRTYAHDFIVNSANPSLNNELTITLPCPTLAIGIDFGGLGFTGRSSATVTLSNGHAYNQPSLPTVGQTTFVGFVSSNPISSLVLDALNDAWVVQDVIVVDCAPAEAKASTTPTPTPEVSYKQAIFTKTTVQPSDAPTEVAENSCIVQGYTSHPGLRLTPLRLAMDYLTSKNLRLIVASDGIWFPLTDTFSSASIFPNLYSIPLSTAQSTIKISFSSKGILTITDTGSSDSLIAGSGMTHLTGSETWSATQTVDLNIGTDKLTFEANLDAHYTGGSQQHPGEATACTINSHYSGEYDAVDSIALLPTCDLLPLMNFDPRDPQYHRYPSDGSAITTKLCDKADKSCTKNEAFRVLLSSSKFIAPTNDTSPVTNCKITMVNLSQTLGLVDNPIQSIINANDYSVTNYTLPGHFLDPGKVVRTITEDSQNIYIETWGEGTGPFPGLNAFLAPVVWLGVDTSLLNAVIRDTFHLPPQQP